MSARPLASLPVAGLLLAGWLSGAPAQAQSLPAGSVIALQSEAGHWLSASPNGTLYASTNANPAAWEEWQIYPPGAGNSPQLCSFFGTTPNAPQNSPTFPSTHGAPGPWDGVLETQAFWSPQGKLVGGTLPSDGGKVALGFPMGVTFLVTEANGQLVWNGQSSGDYLTNPDAPWAGRWKVVAIKNPNPSRFGGCRKGVAYSGGPVHLKSVADGSMLSFSWNHSQWPVGAVHGPTEGTAPIIGRTGQSIGGTGDLGSVTFLTSLVVGYAGGPATNPTVTLQLDGTLQQVVDNGRNYNQPQSWIVLDPTGAAGPSLNLPQGVPFCLKNATTGKLLSANPTQAQLLQSPNTCIPSGTWEQWTISQ